MPTSHCSGIHPRRPCPLCATSSPSSTKVAGSSSCGKSVHKKKEPSVREFCPSSCHDFHRQVLLESQQFIRCCCSISIPASQKWLRCTWEVEAEQFLAPSGPSNVKKERKKESFQGVRMEVLAGILISYSRISNPILYYLILIAV